MRGDGVFPVCKSNHFIVLLYTHTFIIFLIFSGSEPWKTTGNYK